MTSFFIDYPDAGAGVRRRQYVNCRISLCGAVYRRRASAALLGPGVPTRACCPPHAPHSGGGCDAAQQRGRSVTRTATGRSALESMNHGGSRWHLVSRYFWVIYPSRG
jgi:hypothetical protein